MKKRKKHSRVQSPRGEFRIERRLIIKLTKAGGGGIFQRFFPIEEDFCPEERTKGIIHTSGDKE